MNDLAGARGWDWRIELVADPDAVLAESPEIVVSADSLILDRCGRWCSLASAIVESRIEGAWLLDLADAD